MEINIYKYKTELHAHTSPVSSCADISPEELVQIYADAGYDAVCVTNHFTSRLMEMGARQAAEFFLSDYHRAAEEGERLKMSVILGMELRFVENSNDYLLYGFGEDEVEGIYSYMSGTPEDFYRDWKREGLLLIQAHPFRKGMVAKPPSVLDGIEVLNMAPGHNSCPAYSSVYGKRALSERKDFILTAGSDCHHRGYEAFISLLTKEVPKNSAELVSVLRSHDYLFGMGASVIFPYGALPSEQ